MSENKDEILEALNTEAPTGSTESLDAMWDIDETGIDTALGLDEGEADPLMNLDSVKEESKSEVNKVEEEESTEKTEEKTEEPEFKEENVEEKEEVEENVEEKPAKKETIEAEDENEFSLFAKMLAEKEILDIDEDFDSTEQGLIDAFEKSINGRVNEEINSFQQSLPQEGKELLAHLMNGGRVSDFTNAYSGTDVLNLDISKSEQNQRAVLTEFLKLRGDSNEEIQETLNDYKDLGKLGKNAEKAKARLAEYHSQQRKQLAKKQEESKKMQEQKRVEVINTIQETIKDSQEIKGFPLSRKHKKDLVSYMTNANVKITGADGNPTYVTKFQADEMEASQEIDDFILRAYLRMTKFDLSGTKKKAVSNYSSKLKSALQNKKSMTDTKAKLSNKGGGSKNNDLSWDI
tara:strand:- start:1026 stop:2240 length:1215 start_codon:yes stop_codon:yes gene_type:complete